MTTTAHLAIDLGAESGRAVLGRFDGERLTTEEVRRFPNEPVRLPDGLHWDALRLFAELKRGIARAAERTAGRLDSIGIDTWGVDYGLLDRTGALLGAPYHYRDARTDGTLPRLFARAPQAEIYRVTGIQFLPFNTLCQLLAAQDSPLLAVADRLLMMPDLMNYWLTGAQVGEVTIASTSQMVDVHTRRWATDLVERLSLPSRLLPELRPPGSLIGPLLPDIRDECGLTERTRGATVAGHDTASAVAAVPAADDSFAYISSGTWSLVGTELPAPVVAPEAMAANFTNEGGVGGTIRFLRNVAGLWLLQECRRTWARHGRDLTYEQLARLAADAPPFGALVDPDHPTFLPPGDMPARIRERARESDQRPPESVGEIARCALESLALKYRWVIARMEAILGRRAEIVHIVGGGVRNKLLCQLTADALGRPVIAGPAEATAIGNLMVQALALGWVASLDEVREVVRRSCDLQTYEPRGDAAAWDDAFGRFEHVVTR